MARRVVTVGDAPAFALLTESFFLRAGCRVFEVTTLEETLDAGARYNPGLLLVADLAEGPTAAQICKAVRATPWGSSVSILVASDRSDPATVEACFEAGCDDFVPSTVKTHELTSKAASALGLPYRMHFRVVVDLQVVGRSDAGPFIGLARNLSAGGALIECVDVVEMGESVAVTFTIDREDESITVSGRVVRLGWDDANGSHLLAVSFVDVPPEIRARIEAFVEAHR